MVKVKYLMGMALSVALISCGGTGDGLVEENVEFARKQIGKEIELIEASGKFMNPTTLNPDGSVYYCNLATTFVKVLPMRTTRKAFSKCNSLT